jgi:hypothetical protein
VGDRRFSQSDSLRGKWRGESLYASVSGYAFKIALTHLTFNDEDMTRREELGRRFSGVYVSGELVVDALKEWKLRGLGVNEMVTVMLTGGTLKMTYHPLGQLIIDLRDQYLTGNLIIKK